jgi:16S rRNA G1207 methylase RsmC
MTQKNASSEHYFSRNPASDAKRGLIQTTLRGVTFEFLTASSVFSKKKVDTGTRLLIECMILPRNGAILDVGCGYGAVGIAAAKLDPTVHVIMTDVNMRAVRLSQENIQKNRVNNAEVKWGYLYEPIGNWAFDCILSNPPVSAGMDTVKALITQAPKIMTLKAILQMVVRSKIAGKLPELFEATFGNCTVLARESGYRVLIGEKSKVNRA